MGQVPGSVVDRRPHTKQANPDIHATLVWIDSREAFVVRWHDGAGKVVRLESDVPVHRRSTGGARHDPTRIHGAGGAPQTAVESRRHEHLARFIDEVITHIPADDEVLVIGPGTVREHLARELATEDERAHRSRSLATRASAPLTVPQLIAVLRTELGVPAPRKPITRRTRVVRRPPRTPSAALLDELEKTEGIEGIEEDH